MPRLYQHGLFAAIPPCSSGLSLSAAGIANGQQQYFGSTRAEASEAWRRSLGPSFALKGSVAGLSEGAKVADATKQLSMVQRHCYLVHVTNRCGMCR